MASGSWSRSWSEASASTGARSGGRCRARRVAAGGEEAEKAAGRDGAELAVVATSTSSTRMPEQGERGRRGPGGAMPASSTTTTAPGSNWPPAWRSFASVSVGIPSLFGEDAVRLRRSRRRRHGQAVCRPGEHGRLIDRPLARPRGPTILPAARLPQHTRSTAAAWPSPRPTSPACRHDPGRDGTQPAGRRRREVEHLGLPGQDSAGRVAGDPVSHLHAHPSRRRSCRRCATGGRSRATTARGRPRGRFTLDQLASFVSR